MKKCTKCGDEHPATIEYFKRDGTRLTGWCKKCDKEYQKEYRRANADKEKVRKKKYYKENPDKIKEYNKEYRKSNIDKIKKYQNANANKIKEYRKEYYKVNSDKIKEYQKDNADKRKEYYREYYKVNADKKKEYRKDNADKIKQRYKEYQKSNLEVFRKRMQIRRSKKRELKATLTVEQWQIIKEHFNNKCAYCGKEKPLAQEHFIPLSKGGEYTHNNIIPACRSCNSSKGNKYFNEWYPTFEHYSKPRETKINKFLGINDNIQQPKLFV